MAPVAAPEELAEDRAIFDAIARAGLPEPLRAEADLVCDALDLCARGESAAAVERVGGIGRKSPYADWRLFLRGLAPFHQGDLATAREAWSRIDPSRRPGRIASALAGAWQEVTGPTAHEQRSESFPDPKGLPEPPSEISAAARDAALGLMRRASLMAAAHEIVTVRHRDPEQLVSASQAALMIRFEKQYRSLDPDFVATFTAACRELALEQPDVQTFAALCDGTAGPPDDPRSNRLRFLHFGRFIGAEQERIQAAREYIDRDLPRLTHLPAPLRAALASVMLEQAAVSLLGRDNAPGGLIFITSDDARRAERLLREALERCPGNRLAHEALIDLLESGFDQDSPQSAGEAAVIAAKEACVAAFPDQCDHLLDVIDHCIDHGAFARAEPLVRALADQRFDDLLARATPWRFHLERATWLAKKTGAHPDLRVALEMAIASWPVWLSRQWIAFLEAALLLREGDHSGFEAAVTDARAGCPEQLRADAMLAEALERLRVSAADVEPIRQALARGADEIGIDGPIEPLTAVACLYHDLERSGLMLSTTSHSADQIGKALCKRLGGAATWKLGRLLSGGGDRLPVEQPTFWAAFDWLADHDFFGTVKASREPRWLGNLADTHPRGAAAVLDWLERTAPEKLLGRRPRKRLTLVEQAAGREADPIVRARLAEVAREVHSTIVAEEHRKRQKRFAGRRKVPLPDPEEVAQMPPATMPRILQLILKRGGREAVAEAMTILMAPQNPASAKRLADFAKRIGLTPMELIAGLMEGS